MRSLRRSRWDTSQTKSEMSSPFQFLLIFLFRSILGLIQFYLLSLRSAIESTSCLLPKLYSCILSQYSSTQAGTAPASSSLNFPTNSFSLPKESWRSSIFYWLTSPSDASPPSENSHYELFLSLDSLSSYCSLKSGWLLFMLYLIINQLQTSCSPFSFLSISLNKLSSYLGSIHSGA